MAPSIGDVERMHEKEGCTWSCAKCGEENENPGRRVTVSYRFGRIEGEGGLGVRKCVGGLP